MNKRELFKFHPRYLIFTILLFITEILIAIYMHDDFIRPYAGDFLVVILIYCCLKIFINDRVVITAVSVLLFAYCIELLQYFNYVERLGLQGSKLARVILGSSFEWSDMVAYTAGILLVMILENVCKKKSNLMT